MSMKLRLFLAVERLDTALDTSGNELAAADTVDIGVGGRKVFRRPIVSSLTRIRISRDARVPLPCVLPPAEPGELEIVVQVCCCVS